MVADPKTLKPTPRDGETMGEIFMRGNTVMKGYLKNPSATAEALKAAGFIPVTWRCATRTAMLRSATA